jgi:predicted transcriptional regulator
LRALELAAICETVILATLSNSLQGSEAMASERYAYILTVDQKYWNRLCQRSKATLGTHVFIRKNQVAPKQAQQLLFYVTKPKKQVLGEADFVERLTGNCEELWQKFGGESCFESHEEYFKFADGREKMTFIRFSNFNEIASPKTKEELANVLGSLQGFGAGKYLDKETVLQLV